MRTSPLHGEFDQLLLASSEGCGLHLRMRAILTYSMLLVVFSHDCDIKHTCNVIIFILMRSLLIFVVEYLSIFQAESV